MNSIFKYPIEVTDSQSVYMPMGAKILTAQFQGSELCLWALVNPSDPVLAARTIRVHGTGHPIADHQRLKYIGSVQQTDRLIWHIFEVIDL